uniref:Platelet-derived growth factor receptor-like protein n=1 Tax=Hippocampus comes TaxID=109280 RepID=A0A3Q2Z2I9_HIPCM
MTHITDVGNVKIHLTMGCFMICSDCYLVYCHKDAQEQRRSPGKKAKTGKPKQAKAVKKGPLPVINRGKFLKVGETISVHAGDTLELRCRGKPVQWALPSYLEEEDEGRLRIVQHERYGVLTLINTTGADTGEYTCYPMFCEDTDCRKNYDKAIKELFVPSSDYYEVIQLRSNWPTRLPCQVTSPAANVTLHREFPPVEVAVDGTEISFNVKKGFTIHRPRPYHAGALYCVANLGGLRQSSTKYMLIYVNYPMAPPAPIIQASSTSLTAGDNLRVSCTVMGERNVAVEITWEYPGQQVTYHKHSIINSVGGGATGQQIQSILLVDEVRDVDQGAYTCTAENLQGSKSVSTTVKVLPKAKPPKP